MSVWRWIASLWREGPTAPGDGEERESPVLELRIHGLKNTPPGAMLGVAETAVVRERGDELGGFWAEKTPSAPAGVRREAYSWGAMARSGGSTVAGIGQVFVHIGWLLLLPFGLANVAYWTRRIPGQDSSKSWRAGVGAPSIRLFALGLTLLFVTAVASVSIDLVAVQCYRQARGLCANAPGVLDVVTGGNPGLRLAMLALVPLLGVLGLYLISRRARVRYEAAMEHELERADESTARVPLLATKGFWSNARIGTVTERLHFAAALLLLSALLAWNRTFAPAPDCSYPLSFAGSGCLAPDGPITDSPGPAAALVLALAGLAWVVILVARGSSPSGDPQGVRARTALSGWALILSVGIFAMAAVTASLGAQPAVGENGFVGFVATQMILLAAMGSLTVAALGWRRGVPSGLSAALVVASLAIPLAGLVLEPFWAWGSENPVVYFASTGAVVAAQLLLALLWPHRKGQPRQPHPAEAWRGTAPGVVMVIALGAAMVLTSVFVIGAAVAFALPLDSRLAQISVPAAHVEFGVALLGILSAMAVVIVTVVLRQFAALRPPSAEDDSTARRVASARSRAALYQRGEPVVGVLALVTGTALAATIVSVVAASTVVPAPAVPTTDSPAPPLAIAWLGELAQSLAIGTLAAAALVSIVVIAANVFTTRERPIALLWDIICFLPRAGHPFAPPCYAERVVPELNERVRDWLSTAAENGEAGNAERRVVLSAHSLGAVLAASSIFALHSTGTAPLSRVGLITYGTQLRPYFGRLFPELLGPAVLGTQPSGAPALLADDPWTAQQRVDAAARLPGVPTDPDASLRTLLTAEGEEPAWQNLWRPTDYLGFPACSYADNPIDRRVAETGATPSGITVLKHAGYPESEQYAESFAEVLRRLGG